MNCRRKSTITCRKVWSLCVLKPELLVNRCQIQQDRFGMASRYIVKFLDSLLQHLEATQLNPEGHVRVRLTNLIAERHASSL